MNIDFSVRLPTDAHSVPLVRGLLRQALEHLGVPQLVIDEIVLALTEACANVVDHAADQEAYQVDVSIDDEVCRISVLDDGPGFDVDSATESDPEPTDDRGRGLMLMRALVDRLQFVQDADGRHRVTFEKELVSQPRLRLLDPR
ncbi:ATP-binding protein [Blastococcus xanthinilyticus]|uniref:Serine/threonine-protein kinase RsbW n=1 Tax=Blastococcus xanthinilyticus TaxID=1564164 RepID=A0A5S5D7M5_9ACTN|nr:ATP-binding protein [Blastococcus xanthinilyticus]TYP90752.1 serine/threonine-protein kinase RsbW [Blastococcus xanthinilyticus]